MTTLGYTPAGAAAAREGSSAQSAHRHSAIFSSRFQILMIISPLQGSFSLRGPEGCGADPHHNVFCPPAELDSAAGFLIMVL